MNHTITMVFIISDVDPKAFYTTIPYPSLILSHHLFITFTRTCHSLILATFFILNKKELLSLFLEGRACRLRAKHFLAAMVTPTYHCPPRSCHEQTYTHHGCSKCSKQTRRNITRLVEWHACSDVHGTPDFKTRLCT